jgi:hypothetical protein
MLKMAASAGFCGGLAGCVHPYVWERSVDCMESAAFERRFRFPLRVEIGSLKEPMLGSAPYGPQDNTGVICHPAREGARGGLNDRNGDASARASVRR